MPEQLTATDALRPTADPAPPPGPLPAPDLAAVLQTLPHAVLVLAADGRIAYANPAATALVSGAGARQPLVGTDAVDLVPDVHRERARELLSGPGTPGRAARLRLRGEAERWIAGRAAAGPDGTMHLSLTEVTDQARDRRRMRRSERRFRAAFHAGLHGTCLVSERGDLLSANAALGTLLGRSTADLLGAHVGELLAPPGAPPEDWSRHGAVSRQLRHAGGGLLDVVVTTTEVEGDAGERIMLVQVQDVTERRRAEQQLRRLALHDQLTDLPARRLLLERLTAALEDRTAAAPLVGVLFVDLDRFKLVNDALGHAVGDLVLLATARRLRAVTRPQDVVGRLAGDEFVVVCPGLQHEGEALAIAERLGEAARSPVATGTDEVLVSASVGVAFGRLGDDATADLLLQDADTAMYAAKQRGCSRYEIFDTALRQRAESRHRVRGLLLRAVEQGRLVVHYQPVVDLETRAVVGVEAVMRVRDDDGTLLLPEAFLDVALEGGLLPALDEALLRMAATQVAGWQRPGAPLDLAVNVCAGQVSGDLTRSVLRTLSSSGLPPERLVVEVTEQTLVSAGETAEDALRELDRHGVRIAIDDFGTGWASLTYLRRLPVSIVKVDRSFVAGLPRDADDVVIVGAVLELSQRLGMDTTAEGVETPEQAAALLAMGATFGQGWLFGGPVPAQEVPALLGLF